MSQVKIIFHLKYIYYEVVIWKVKPQCYTAEHSPRFNLQLLLLLLIIIIIIINIIIVVVVYNKHLLNVVNLNNMLTTYVICGFHDGKDSEYFLLDYDTV
jgi:hypothetical protein